MTIEELQVLFTVQTSQVKQAVNNIKQEFKGLENSTKKTTKNMEKSFDQAGNNIAKTMSGAMKKISSIIAVAGIGKVLKDSIMKGMEAIESESLVETVFGNQVDDIRAWSTELQNTLGLNGFAVRKNTAMLYNMTKSMGLTESEAMNLSKSMTLLAEDVASFYNLSSEEAFNKIRAGLTGETEPLKQIGVLVDENTVKMTAYQNGIASVGSELTNSQKVMARQIAIENQLSTASGDLARTIQSPANQLRIFRGQLELLAINLGQAFMPIVQVVLPILNNLVKGLNKVISAFATFMKALFGMEMSVGGTASAGARAIGDMARSVEGAESNAGGMARNLGRAGQEAKKLKGFLAGFDELNTTTREEVGGGSGGSGGGDIGGGVGGIEIETPSIDFTQTDSALEQIPQKFQDMADKVKGVLENFFEPIITAWDNVKDRLIEQVKKAWENVKAIFSNAKETIKGIWNNGGSDIFQNIIETILLIGTIAGRVFNETLVPIIQGFIDLLNPEESKWASLTVGAIEGITDAIKGLVEYLAGDGFYWVDLFVKSFLTFKAVTFVTEMALTIKTIYDVIKAFIVGIGVKATDLAMTGAIIGLYVKDFIIAIAGAVKSLGAMAIAGLTATVSIFGLTLPIWAVVLAITGLIAIIVLCVKHWDDIKEAGAKAWEKIKEAWNKSAEWFKEKFDKIKQSAIEFIEKVKEKFTEWWNKIVQLFGNVKEWFVERWEAIKTTVIDLVDTAKNKFAEWWNKIVELFGNIKTWFTDRWNNIKNGVADLVNNGKAKFSDWWNNIKNIFANIGGWFSEKWNSIKTGIDNLKTNIGTIAQNMWTNLTTPFKNAYTWFKSNVVDKISQAFSGVVNTVKGAFNSVIRSVNWAISCINNAMTFTLPDWIPLVGGKGFTMNIPRIPELARGGIVDERTLFYAGERGKEAVLPLENNTGWLDIIADKISNNMGQTTGGKTPLEVTINLGGNKLGKYMIDNINDLQRQAGKQLIDIY